MENNESISYRKNGFKRWLIATPVLLLIIIVVWLILGVYPHLDRIENVANQTRELNECFSAEIQDIETIGSQVYPGIIILTEKDMQSLKKNLFALKGEVDKAIELSHQDTINIVDRVNLYVTIGIVLLTLLGVFVPVIVQNFGKDEIKELKEELKKNAGMLDEKIGKAERKLKRISSQIVKKDNEIKKISDETKNIPPLKLSYALLRALDKNLIRSYSINQIETYDYLIGIFKNIGESFKECKSGKIFPKENVILDNSIFGLNQDLQYAVLMAQFNKMEIKKFELLSESIKELIKNKNKEEETLFDPVIRDIGELIKSFEKKKKEVAKKKQPLRSG